MEMRNMMASRVTAHHSRWLSACRVDSPHRGHGWQRFAVPSIGDAMRHSACIKKRRQWGRDTGGVECEPGCPIRDVEVLRTVDKIARHVPRGRGQYNQSLGARGAAQAVTQIVSFGPRRFARHTVTLHADGALCRAQTAAAIMSKSCKENSND
ncbi:MAG TPA: hypothetical protein VFR96_09305 [Povalibacter sp.]|jgi:hypothetical protein|nr:hypothetical protein [Povalibacter sp.]